MTKITSLFFFLGQFIIVLSSFHELQWGI